MNGMGTTVPYSHAWKEWRRLQAWELKKLGWKQQDIAQALSVSKGAVSRWIHQASATFATFRATFPGGNQPISAGKGSGSMPRSIDVSA